MKLFTNTFDLATPSPHRFWVSPYSDFKIGVKIVKNGESVANTFTVKAGATTLTPDEDKIDGFTLYTIKSGNTGFVEYTIEVANVAEKLKLLQIVTDSTVFEVGEGGGDVPADVATQTWVNSQISDFITEDALVGYATEDYVDSAVSDFVEEDELTAYATKDELTGYVENGDLTAYYTKSETSSATELADAFASAGGGAAVSAFDLSESPVWSKTQVEEAFNNNICLPQTVAQLTADGSLSVFNVDTIDNTTGFYGSNKFSKIVVGTNVKTLGSRAFGSCYKLSSVIFPETEVALSDSTFRSSTMLTEIKIPSTWTQIPNNCFRECTGLKRTVISDSVTSIQYGAFSYGTGGYIDFGNTRTTVCQAIENMGLQPLNNTCYVPDALYDQWIAASWWSSHTNLVHRHSELEAPYLYENRIEGGALSGTTGTPAAIEAVKSVYETDWASLSATADANTFYVVLPDPA